MFVNVFPFPVGTEVGPWRLLSRSPYTLTAAASPWASGLHVGFLLPFPNRPAFFLFAQRFFDRLPHRLGPRHHVPVSRFEPDLQDLRTTDPAGMLEAKFSPSSFTTKELGLISPLSIFRVFSSQPLGDAHYGEWLRIGPVDTAEYTILIPASQYTPGAVATQRI